MWQSGFCDTGLQDLVRLSLFNSEYHVKIRIRPIIGRSRLFLLVFVSVSVFDGECSW